MANNIFNAETQRRREYKLRKNKTLLTNRIRLSLRLCVSAFIFSVCILSAEAQIAVRGEQVWTMTANEPIRDGVILINNGKIERIGAAGSIQIPASYRVINAKVVTPGLIDARTVVGISGYLSQPHDQMQVETSAPMQPELRAIDAYNPEEKLIEWLRSFGVTT
ncbi:MAG TPA: hypothetical protein VF596_01015, partial [Pyrinomonadaceae bacterium]